MLKEELSKSVLIILKRIEKNTHKIERGVQTYYNLDNAETKGKLFDSVVLVKGRRSRDLNKQEIDEIIKFMKKKLWIFELQISHKKKTFLLEPSGRKIIKGVLVIDDIMLHIADYNLINIIKGLFI